VTDIVPAAPPGAVVSTATPEIPMPAGAIAIRQWAMTLADCTALAEAFVDTAFMPDSYKPRLPDRATAEDVAAARLKAIQTGAAAIMHGATIGFDPLPALQNVIVINGRPSLYAEAMKALLVAHGHDVWTEELTDTRAIVCGRRAGTTHVERAVVTMDQAKRAGWTRNAKYGTEPQAMLYARALSRACRSTAPDVLKGIASSVEEAWDTEDQGDALPSSGTTAMRREQSALEGPPARPVKKAAAKPRRSVPPPSDTEGVDTEQPPVPGQDDEAQEPAEAPSSAQSGEDRITDAQMKKLHASFSEHGIAKRELALAFCFDVTGREIDSTKNLTKAEASQVIDHLAQLSADVGVDTEPGPRDETADAAGPEDTADAGEPQDAS
jgi:hypothetical protein